MSSIKRKKVVRARAVKAKKGSARKRQSFAQKLRKLGSVDMVRANEAAMHGLGAVVIWAALTYYSDHEDPIQTAGVEVGRALLAAADHYGEWNDWGLK